MLRRVRRWWGDRNLDIDGEGLDAPSEALPPSWVDASEATDCGVRDAVNAIELDVVTAMRRLTGGLAQAERFSEHCEASSRTIQDRVAEVRAATFTAASNSVALATATQQVSNSAEQVGSAMGNAQDRLDAAATRAVEATQMMTGLAIATVEIRGIVDSIAEIARQTNLLALNATIEAARAGDAGRGFGIVAIEVKELSVEVRDSVEHIRRRVEHLALAAQGSASIVNDALRMVRDVNPVIAAIGDASREQATAAAELSRSAQETARYVETVLHRVEEIDRVALSAAGESANVRRALSDVARQAGSMLRRFIPILRHAAFADRRRHDRFPADYGVELRLGTLVMASRTIDIGLGGVLVAGVPDERLRPGMEGRIAVAGLPDLACRLLAVSDLGLHLAFDAGARDAGLQALIRDIEQSYLPLVQRALSFSDAVRAVMENALATGLLTEADLFDVDYIDVEGSQPPQYLNRALGTLEELLPPLFAATMSGDERLVFAIAIDRNGYVPVHQPDVSLPQRPGETQWNIGHSRNRRIFDDRAGIMAARSVRPFLVQSYRRELGGDVVQFVREVDAPLRVRGRHWGGVRMAYRM